MSPEGNLLADRKLPTTLSEAAEFHRLCLQRLNRSPLTLSLYKIYQDSYLTFLLNHNIEPSLDALNPANVRKWQLWLRAKSTGRRGGAVTEHQGVIVLKVWARWSWEQDIYPFDPLARLKPPSHPSAHRKPYTELELQRLIDAAKGVRDRALVLLLLDTGCRIGELCKAELADVDLDQGSIVFRHTKTRRVREVLFGVDGLADGGPCLAALREWLAVRTATAGVHALFTSSRGLPLRPKYARIVIARLGKAAGVAGPVIPHRFRHSAATQFLTQRPGAEIQLRARLGHLSHDILSNYIQITEAMSHDGATVGSVSSRLLAAAPIATPARSDMQVLIDAVRTDPELRKTLLQALIGAA